MLFFRAARKKTRGAYNRPPPKSQIGDRQLVQGLKGDATYLIVDEGAVIRDYGINAVRPLCLNRSFEFRSAFSYEWVRRLSWVRRTRWRPLYDVPVTWDTFTLQIGVREPRDSILFRERHCASRHCRRGQVCTHLGCVVPWNKAHHSAPHSSLAF